jgi:hypothetical protein
VLLQLQLQQLEQLQLELQQLEQLVLQLQQLEQLVLELQQEQLLPSSWFIPAERSTISKVSLSSWASSSRRLVATGLATRADGGARVLIGTHLSTSGTASPWERPDPAPTLYVPGATAPWIRRGLRVVPAELYVNRSVNAGPRVRSYRRGALSPVVRREGIPEGPRC